MKSRTCNPHLRMTVCLLLLMRSVVVFSQGTFQNLDFESSVLVPVPGDQYGRVQFAPAFPGWSGSIGANVETLALYNNMFLDSTGIGIQGPGTAYPRIAGNYTAMIQSGFGLTFPLTPAIASLSQTALVPVGTASLKFNALAYGPFQVALNDIPLSLTPVQVNAGYTLYGVNIPTYAGTTAKLTITALHKSTPPIISSLFIDSIQFSDQPIVPEPCTGTIFLIGLIALAFSKTCRR